MSELCEKSVGILGDHWFSLGMIAVWCIAWGFCQKLDLVPVLANKGTTLIGREYYRYVTGLLVHSNIWHLFFNASALYFVGRYLEPQISPWKLLLFSASIGIATEMMFSVIYPKSISAGGSPIVFALIGLMVALPIGKADSFDFRLGTWYGNWIVGYAVLSDIPLFSDNWAATLLIHAIPLLSGILLGYLGVVWKLF